MKKIISLVATLALIVSMLAFSVSAAADIEFSISKAEGKPGDIVEIDVFVDKNLGTWCMNFDVKYDSRCFDLVSVTNGKIFLDGENEPGVIDDSGAYKYYACNNELEDVFEVGKLVTLQFKILKAAPNGEYPIDLYFPDDGEGWFFGIVDLYESEYENRSVEVVKEGSITVTGSTAESLPETTVPAEDKETEKNADKETGKVSDDTTSSGHVKYETEMVTEYVTDKEGEIVTDVSGEPLVTEVPIAIPEKTPISSESETKEEEKAPETEIVYVTDAEGEQVTEPDGEPVTEIVVVEEEEGLPVNTVVIVVCIVAVVVAAALIAFVVVSRRKDDSDEVDEKSEDSDEE